MVILTHEFSFIVTFNVGFWFLASSMSYMLSHSTCFRIPYILGEKSGSGSDTVLGSLLITLGVHPMISPDLWILKTEVGKRKSLWRIFLQLQSCLWKNMRSQKVLSLLVIYLYPTWFQKRIWRVYHWMTGWINWVGKKKKRKTRKHQCM